VITEFNAVKKFNAVTEILLYECHGIRKYTIKRSQMSFRTFSHHRDQLQRIMYFLGHWLLCC